jgi:hypothetical protein
MRINIDHALSLLKTYKDLESQDPEYITIGISAWSALVLQNIFDALGWNGICEISFKHDQDFYTFTLCCTESPAYTGFDKAIGVDFTYFDNHKNLLANHQGFQAKFTYAYDLARAATLNAFIDKRAPRYLRSAYRWPLTTALCVFIAKILLSTLCFLGMGLSLSLITASPVFAIALMGVSLITLMATIAYRLQDPKIEISALFDTAYEKSTAYPQNKLDFPQAVLQQTLNELNNVYIITERFAQAAETSANAVAALLADAKRQHAAQRAGV